MVTTSASPSSDIFRTALQRRLRQAELEGKSFVDVKSGALHREVGDYPGPSHRMPTCCDVMRQGMKASDQILSEPLKGRGASLIVRYGLPR